MSLCVSVPVAAPPTGLASRLRRFLGSPAADRSASERPDADAPFAALRCEAPAAPGTRRRFALGETNVLLL